MAKTISLEISRQSFNSVYLKLFDIHSRISARMGGAGSGKSVFTAKQIVWRLWSEKPHNWLVIRKQKNSHRHSTYQEFINVLQEWGIFKYCPIQKSDLTIMFPNGNRIIFLGLDDPEKLKSISNITGVWIEEATAITQEEFEEVDRRLRGKPTNYYQIILTYNPISTNNWTYEAIYQKYMKGDPDVDLLVTTYKDNKFLDEDYKRRLEMAQGNARLVYTLGEYAKPEFLVYQNFELIDEFPDTEDNVYGVDFGFENPQSIIRVYAEEQSVYFDEISYETHQTIPQLGESMKALIPSSSICIADSASPGSIAELNEMGHNVIPVKKYAGSVMDGINWILGKKIYITRRSENLIKEIQTYSRMRDKNGKVLDEISKGMDHAMDAMRYGTQYYRDAVNEYQVGFIK